MIAGVLLSAGCAGTPSVAGVAGVPPAPNKEWTPPAPPRDTLPATPSSFPSDLLTRVNTLTLGDVVDLALRNNPQTQISWANARAAAAAYGGSKSLYYPTIDGEIGVTHLKSSPTFSNDSVLRPSLTQTSYGPTLTVSWLIADLGGRAGTIESARQALIAANWTHNATLQNVVLAVESAYFNYMANKGLVESEKLSVKEAETSLQSTQQRQHVGLATIADVLQAKTALSQATLTLETTEGDLETTRGALAAAMGLPANAPYDVDAAPATIAAYLQKARRGAVNHVGPSGHNNLFEEQMRAVQAGQTLKVIPRNLIDLSNGDTHRDLTRQLRELGLPRHDAMMPRALCERLIKFLTEPGDLVYDPFGGSGTVGLAAAGLGRRFALSDRSLAHLLASALRFEGASFEPRVSAA